MAFKIKAASNLRNGDKTVLIEYKKMNLNNFYCTASAIVFYVVTIEKLLKYDIQSGSFYSGSRRRIKLRVIDILFYAIVLYLIDNVEYSIFLKKNVIYYTEISRRNK